MLWPTHRKIGTTTGLACIAVGQILEIVPSNIILNKGTAAEFILQASIIYLCCKWGSDYPDLDHPISGPSNKNILSKALSLIIKALGAKHRSRLTHSIDSVLITFALCFLATRLGVAYVANNIPAFDLGLLNNEIVIDFLRSVNGLLPLIFMSLAAGAISHIFADMFTEGGGYISVFLPKIVLVPANIKILGFQPFLHKFKTNGSWEKFVYKISDKISAVMFTLVLFLTFKEQIVALFSSAGVV